MLLMLVTSFRGWVALEKTFKMTSSTFSCFLQTPVYVEGNNFFLSRRDFHRSTVSYERAVVAMEECTFTLCSDDIGGAVLTDSCSVRAIRSIFEANQARIGGACHHIRSFDIVSKLNCFVDNVADYNGAFAVSFAVDKDVININTINLSQNKAKKWSGGMRIDNAGGTVSYSLFTSNSAGVCGAFFDFSWRPQRRNVTNAVFYNNSSMERGGAVCAFHILHESSYENVQFQGNRCKFGANSISIESINVRIYLANVSFDGSRDSELGMRFGGSHFIITDDVRFEKHV